MTDPSDSMARWQAFQSVLRQDRFADALILLREFPAAARKDFQWIAHEAFLLGKLGDHEGEISRLRQLIKVQPGSASLWVSLAHTLKTLGRTEEAVSALHEAIAIQPGYGKPWWLLSDLKSFRFQDKHMKSMEQLLAGDLGVEDRTGVHFALAKALEDRGLTEQSFDHYAKANRLRAASIDPASAVVTPKVDRSIAIYTAEFLNERAGAGSTSTAPIFIVGMPRSGSTLIEQILASHPLIEGTSELPLISHLNREIAQHLELPARDLFDRIASLDAAQLRSLGDAYLDRAKSFRRTERPYFTDKLPGNWTNIGLIRLILPHAKIIDARRHPLATGYSNFKQNYAAGAAFSFGLDTIGRYYRDYLRLVSHFERVDPEGMHRVINERLIGDFEAEVRALLAYVGVPFDRACLDFHRNSRAVATPSAEQVRRPINSEGVGQWRAVEPWLSPLKQALGPALEGWDLPPGMYRDEQ